MTQLDSKAFWPIQQKSTRTDFQASKWLSYQILIDKEEMHQLLDSLPPLMFYNVSELIDEKKKPWFSKEDFCSEYCSYIEELKEGKEISRAIFSSAMTVDPKAVYQLQSTEGRSLIRTCLPLVQLRPHSFSLTCDGRVQAMTLGKDSIRWGIQMSYPQIFLDPDTHSVMQVLKCPKYNNTSLFHALAKWIRSHTKPTPLFFDKKKIVGTFRAGEGIYKWVNDRHDLREKGIKCGSN